MLYTPILPEAASGTLEPRHVVVPLRVMCPHAELLLGPCHRARRVGAARRPLESELGTHRIRYKQLVVALGAVARTLPVPGLAEHGLGFKNLADAIYLRNHVLRQLEAAAAAARPEARAAHLTFVFVGAGYAGVEALAELSDLVRDALRYYPGLARRRNAGCSWTRRRRSCPRSRADSVSTRPASSPARASTSGSATTLASLDGEHCDALRRDAAPDPRRSSGQPASAPTRCSHSSGCRSTTGAACSSTRRCAVEGRENVWALGDGARGAEHGDAGPARPADLPARASPGAAAGQEPDGRRAALPVPHARPGGDARPVQGDRRRPGPALARLPRLVRHAGRTTCTSCPCFRESCVSWSTGRWRSSSGATSPSSRCSAIPPAWSGDLIR